MRGRCYNIVTGEAGEDICTLGPIVWDNFDNYWVMKDMDVTGATTSMGGSFRCASMEEDCLQLGKNPGNEAQGFDAIGQAMMSIFEIFTMGWVDLMYNVQDSVGYWHWMYFVLVVLLGPMFCLQLFLVVICNRASQVEAERKEAEESKKREAEALLEAQKAAEVVRDKQVFSAIDVDNSGQISLDELRDFMTSHDPSITEEEILKRFTQMDKDNSGAVDKAEFVAAGGKARERARSCKVAHFFDEIDQDKSNTISLNELRDFLKKKYPGITDEDVQNRFARMKKNKDGSVDRKEAIADWEVRTDAWSELQSETLEAAHPALSPRNPKEITQHHSPTAPEGIDEVDQSMGQPIFDRKSFGQIDIDHSGDISVDEFRAFMQSKNPEVTEEEVQERFNQMDKNHDGTVSKAEFVAANGLVREPSKTSAKQKRLLTLEGLQRKIKAIAVSERLQNLVMVVILLSTCFMAMDGLCEYDSADCDFANACLFGGRSCAHYKGTLEFLNLGFTIIFVFELTIKIVGFGPVTFFRGEGSGMNIFDTVIVVNSVIEFQGGLEAGTCFFDFFQGAATDVVAQTWPPGSEDFNLGRVVTAQDMFGKDYVLSLSAITPYEMAPAWKDSILNIPRVVQGDDGTWSYNPMMYLCCSAGGGAAVLRALRLVRLVKLLRRFPEIIKQFKILGDAMGSIAALLVLIVIMMFIFTILGMNLLGGSIRGDWPPSEYSDSGLMVGMEVYLTIPWDENGGKRRHGKVHWYDFENHPRAPWKVELEYGGNKGGGGGWDPFVNVSVGGVLDEYGHLWAATIDDDTTGVPIITGFAPRFNFDNLGSAFLTAYAIFFQADWNLRLYEAMGSGLGIGFAFYYYALIILGNWILLNLFIAILIGKFTEQRAAKLEENMDNMEAEFLKRLSGLDEEEQAEELLTFFNEFDVDGSGEIDKDEFNTALLKLGVALKPNELSKLMLETTGDNSDIIVPR